MVKSKFGRTAFVLAVHLALCESAFASTASNVSAANAEEKIYIVMTDQESVPTWFKNQFPGETFNSMDLRGLSYGQTVLDTNLEVLQSHGIGNERIISNLCFAGAMVIARLSEDEAQELREDPSVRSVAADSMFKLQTDTSPRFLGLRAPSSPWARDIFGENVVIGVLDSGIHPEHPSFADTMVDLDRAGNPTGSSKPYPPPPASWNGNGTCQFGNRRFNSDDASFTCNKKLLAARFYIDGFLAIRPTASDEFRSARASDNHGTHVASTAAGNAGVPANINGSFEGRISGIAPRARLSIYKVCWNAPPPPPGQDPDDTCSRADTINAIEQAIADGVDVINFSVGGAGTTFGASEQAWLSAANAGIWVVTSQGNGGPGAGSVGTPAGVPWITSVGSMQDDRVIDPVLRVSTPAAIAGSYDASEGSGPVRLDDIGEIKGDLVLAEPILGCSTLQNDLTGKIALVRRGSCTFREKYVNAAAAGARAIVVYQDGTARDRIRPFNMAGLDETTIPGVMLGFFGGSAIAQQLNNDQAVRVAFGGAGNKIFQVNRVALGSSRGPNRGALDIIKPDLAAPGVRILAAGSPFTVRGPDSGELFAVLSGTSMASPHVAGIFALLHQQYPGWSPAMARSAVMTTARQGLLDTDGSATGDPFDFGSGLLNPARVFNPGLVYDVGEDAYLAFSCENNVPATTAQRCASLRNRGFSTDGSQLNYPSIGVSDLDGRKTVRRRVKSVMGVESSFRVSVNAPEGVNVQVTPSLLTLKPNAEATYRVNFTATQNATLNEWVFGSLTWSNGTITVRSPIAVRPTARFEP